MAVTAKRVVKNSFWLYGKVFFSMIASLLSTRIILNGLGIEDFGIYNIVGGAIAMLGFLNAAMASATQRFMSYAEGEGDTEKKNVIFNVSIVLHFFLSIVVCILLVVCGFFFFDGLLSIPSNRIFAAEVVYVSLILSTMLTVMSVPYDAVINSHEDMRYYAFVGVLESSLRLIAAYLCIYIYHDKLIAYGVLIASVPIISLTLMRIYCHRKYVECKFSISRNWDFQIVKDLSKFAGWNFFGTSSTLIGNYGLRIIMNHFYGVLLNAAQGVAAQICSVVMIFSSNMVKALNPVIAKTEGARNRDKVVEMTMTGNKMGFYMLAFIGIPLFLECDYIMALWLKTVPEWSVIFVKLQIIRLLLEQITKVSETTIYAQGNISLYNIIIGIVNVLPMLLTYVIFSMGAGPYAMFFITITIFGIVICLVRVYFMRRNCNIPYSVFVSKCLSPIMASFFVVFLISMLPVLFMGDGIIRFFIVLLISSISGCITYYYIGLDSSEKQIVNALVEPVISRYKRKK